MKHEQLLVELAKAEQAYRAAASDREAVWRPLSNKVKEIRAAIAASLIEGANPCPTCGEMPHGIAHDHKGEPVDQYFEVGCLTCKSHRAQGAIPEAAVKYWNAGPSKWAKSKVDGSRCRVGDDGKILVVYPDGREEPAG